jgi:anti-anti-sigma regulatory factor
MNTLRKHQENDATYQCPVCGNSLPHSVPTPPFDAPCSECGAYLWCRRRSSSGPIFLQAIPGRSPEPSELERVIQALERDSRGEEVILDLSLMELVTSSFMARMITLNRRIQASGSRMSVTGLQPLVRDIFQRARLDLALNLVEDGEASPNS